VGADDVPDPQDPATFRRSRLSHRRDGRHGALREHYRRLLALRRAHEDLIAARWPEVEVDGTTFTMRRPGLVVRANLGPAAAGGLPAWGVAIDEEATARTDSPQAFPPDAGG